MRVRCLLAASTAALACAATARAENPQIAGLQVALRAHGLYCGGIDGVAGQATVKAIRSFQRHAKLPATGVADVRTRLALGPLGHPVLGRRALQGGDVGLDVSVLQFLLTRRGLSPGPLDGVLDVRTTGALRRFQRSAGLRPDGVAGPATIQALVRPGTPIIKVRAVTAPTARYTVRPGDSLSAIAAAHGVTPSRVARLNGLKLDAPLLIGKRLRVPVGRRSAPPPAPASTTRYVVRPGDSLTAIAAARGTTVARLARLNGLRLNGPLLIGTRLRVPTTARPEATATYVVRSGDSLTAIASAYRTTVQHLSRLNDLAPADILQAGAKLRVPAGRGPETPKMRTAAASGLDLSPDEVRAAIDGWAAHYGVDQHLARALGWMESGYHTDLTSVSGAWGVMQILPVTWDFAETVLIGEQVPRTADGNIRVGVAYLHHLLEVFDDDERLALAGWYQGARSVRERGLLPESETFVTNVLALRDRM
jgi:LysM repeat protein